MHRTSARLGLVLAACSVAAPLAARAGVTWTATAGGPLGGTVTRMRMVGGAVWASLYSGGIYRRDTSWSQVAIGRGMPENRALDFVADPTDPQRVFAAQIIACGGRTTDAAEAWTPLCDAMLPAADGDNFTSTTLALDPADPGTVFVPGHNHRGERMLLVSSDGGDSWVKRADFAVAYDFNHLVMFGGRAFLSTREHGVLVSGDGGESWSPLNDGLSTLLTARFAEFGGALYLVGGRLQFNVRGPGTLYRLNEDGTAWTATTLKVATGVATAEDGSALYVGGETGALWRSTDGSTFTRIAPPGAVPGWIGEIVADGSTIYAGVAGSGIWRSTNGGATFAEDSAGLKAIAAREVHVNPKNPNNVYVVQWDRGGIFTSTNAGASFKRAGTTHNILTMATDPRAFTHFYAGGSVLLEANVSSSGAVAWSKRVKPGPATSVVKALAVHPGKGEIVLAGIAQRAFESQPGSGVFYSVDRGRTWKHSTGVPNKAVYSIAFNKTSPSTVYATALGAGIYRSTNTGRSFTRIGPAALKYPYKMAIDPKNPKHLVVGTSPFYAGIPASTWTDPAVGGGLWESTNGGGTWRNLTASLVDYPATDEDRADFKVWKYNLGHQPNFEQILIDPRSAKHIIVGHHGESILSTPDGGATWRKEGDGMIPGAMHNYGYCLGQSAKGDVVFGCTCGRGVFRGTVPSAAASVRWEGSSWTASFSTAGTPRTPAQARAVILSGATDHRH